VRPIASPPLRERRDDVPELVRHQIASVAARLDVEPVRIEPAAIARLSAYDYPGNVRELENEIERLFALLGAGALVTSDALSAKFHGVGGIEGAGYTDSVRRFKTRLVTGALEEAGGNRAKAAKRLGVHRSNLVRMLRELGLSGRSGSEA
jgi:DNA-binding NtrC family response regulator